MADRIFISGSKWLYFKLYTGTKSADKLLTDVLYPYVLQLKNKDIIKQFFFIRYGDPHFHVRLRILLPERKDFTETLGAFYDLIQPSINNGQLWKVQIDTYKRELERYGHNTIEIVEKIFDIDSDSTINLISLLNHGDGDEHRWLLALVLIDDLLSLCNYNFGKKEILLKTLSEGFQREFNFTNPVYKRQLGNKYRKYKDTIYKVLTEKDEGLLKNYLSVLNKRNKELQPYVLELLSKNARNIPVVPEESLLSSIIHMTLNRLFRSKNRQNEMVVYDFLYRYYESVIARTKKQHQ